MPLSELQESLVDEISMVIAKHRGGQNAGEMARTVLERDGGSQLLVGLSKGAAKAVLYDRTLWSVKMVDFGAEGIRGVAGSQVAKCRHRDELELWVKKNSEGLAWIHLRFRWAESKIDSEC